jgi:hypothetical protein
VEERGEGERDMGSGTWAGVGGVFSRFDLILAIGLFLGKILGSDLALLRVTSFFLAGEATGGTESAGSSQTSGRPACGPLKFRIEEKCSQS